MFMSGIAYELFNIHFSKSFVAGCSIALVVLLMALGIFPETRSLVWRTGSSTSSPTAWATTGCFFGTVLLGLPYALSTVRVASGAWDRWLGDLSYPLYLFHWIPRQWYYAQVDWSAPTWWNLLLLTANLSLALLGAIVLLQLVDRPIQQARGRWLKASSFQHGTAEMIEGPAVP